MSTEVKKSPWRDEFYVKAYQLARSGSSNGEIARVLKVKRRTFDRWIETKPALASALEDARGGVNKGTESFVSYIYKSLSPKNKVLWDQLEAAGNMNNPEVFIDRVMQSKGKRTKQQMWVHALIMSNFNGSEACRKVGIPKTTLDNWVRHDKAFVKLLEEIEWHRNNFFEDAFVSGVARGETALILHAAKTKLADRGYGSTKTVNVSVSGQIEHKQVNVGELLETLPVDYRTKLLSHMKALREARNEDVPDAEIVTPNS